MEVQKVNDEEKWKVGDEIKWCGNGAQNVAHKRTEKSQRGRFISYFGSS